jgi:RNA polymerase sigma-70 factor (ECF subfamily)
MDSLDPMNLPPIRGVLPMYKEKRAVGARVNQSVQEWILSHTGESEAERCGGEREATEVRHREWEGLLAENAPLAFRMARAVLKNDADADEVAQEALLRAYRRFERLRERSKFRAWLVRISFRLALDRLRSTRRRREREAEWVREKARSASSAGQDAEFRDHLERALGELPEKQRLVVLLAAMEGHSIEEVASLVGVPPGTVKSRLFMAKKALAEKLRCFVNPTASR